MTEIKIISGSYGCKVNGHIRVKDRNSGAFELNDDEAERLIALGVAKKVKNDVATPDTERNAAELTSDTLKAENAAESEINADSDDSYNLSEEQLKMLTNAALKKLAEDMGLDTSNCKVKSDFIAVILTADVETEPLSDSIPPDVGAELPVI